MEMLDDFMPGEVGLIFVLFVSRFFFFWICPLRKFGKWKLFDLEIFSNTKD